MENEAQTLLFAFQKLSYQNFTRLQWWNRIFYVESGSEMRTNYESDLIQISANLLRGMIVKTFGKIKSLSTMLIFKIILPEIFLPKVCHFQPKYLH